MRPGQHVAGGAEPNGTELLQSRRRGGATRVPKALATGPTRARREALADRQPRAPDARNQPWVRTRRPAKPLPPPEIRSGR
jgi:hypothetical protein